MTDAERKARIDALADTVFNAIRDIAKSEHGETADGAMAGLMMMGSLVVALSMKTMVPLGPWGRDGLLALHRDMLRSFDVNMAAQKPHGSVQ